MPLDSPCSLFPYFILQLNFTGQNNYSLKNFSLENRLFSPFMYYFHLVIWIFSSQFKKFSLLSFYASFFAYNAKSLIFLFSNDFFTGNNLSDLSVWSLYNWVVYYGRPSGTQNLREKLDVKKLEARGALLWLLWWFYIFLSFFTLI